MKKLMVIGAGGVMGERVLKIARRVLPEVYLVGASRHISENEKKDYLDETRRFDIFDVGNLKNNLRDVAAVINTVGAFEYDPVQLLRACFDSQCHYIDIAENGKFINQVKEITEKLSNENQENLNSKPVFVSSGCSTVPGLIRVLVQNFSKYSDMESVDVFLSLGSRKDVSPTLLYSLLRPLGQKADDGAKFYRRIEKKLINGEKPRYFGRYPSPFDADGLQINEQFFPAHFFVGMDRAAYSYALKIGGLFLPYFSDRAVRNLYYLVKPFRPLIKKFGEDLGLLILSAKDANGEIIDEIEIRADSEGLNIPALPAVWTARRFFEPDEDLSTGFYNLEDLFSPQQMAAWLCQEGFQINGMANDLEEDTQIEQPKNKFQTAAI